MAHQQATAPAEPNHLEEHITNLKNAFLNVVQNATNSAATTSDTTKDTNKLGSCLEEINFVCDNLYQKIDAVRQHILQQHLLRDVAQIKSEGNTMQPTESILSLQHQIKQLDDLRTIMSSLPITDVKQEGENQKMLDF